MFDSLPCADRARNDQEAADIIQGLSARAWIASARTELAPNRRERNPPTAAIAGVIEYNPASWEKIA
jgi:hypothetical protein